MQGMTRQEPIRFIVSGQPGLIGSTINFLPMP